MRIKAIEMQGFKSFPDKTRLEIEDGITVIVGPNGSGKSNITDAVRWVLGEMSTKSIRSAKMEDVIFGGSDNRRAMNYAEVTLFIDNTRGLGKLESDRDEVTVTRRYFRDGDSEYLINGQKRRMRDIAELFMNTGVGKTGYSNIGQGKIAEIISQKSDERRSVFEEAAGISKYRARKNEAERKLKETSDNLLRVGDILAELGSRVGPLEKEANAAKKYLDLHEKKKAIDVALWVYEAENMKTVADETERLFVASKLELESVDAEIARDNIRLDSLYTSSNEGKQSAEVISANINEAIEKRHGIESSNAVLENDISHTEERIAQTRQDIENRKRELSDGKTRSETLKKSINEKKAELDGVRSEIEAKNTEIAKQEDVCLLLEDEILRFDDLRQEAENALTECKLKLSSLEGSHEAGFGRKNELVSQIALIEETIASYSDECARIEKTIKSYSDSIATNSCELEKVKKAHTENSEKLDGVRAKLSSLKNTLDAKTQRVETIKKMDELLEGYSYSVKNVMHASDNNLIKGIFGPVSRLIRVKKEYSVAIETSLGANIQNIVTDNEESAKGAIAYLKRTGGGRATFYPITSVKRRQPAVSPELLKKHKGFIGMGDTLCDCDSKFDGIIGNLLGATAIFDNIDNASYTAKAFDYRIRLVTLDGQIINAGGSFTGGSVKSDSGILTRTSEISAINEEITSINIEIKSKEAEEKELLDTVSELDGNITDLSGRVSLMQTLLLNEQTSLGVAKARLISANEKLEGEKNELEGIGKESDKFDSEKSNINREIKLAEDKLNERRAELDEARSASSDADDMLQDLRSELGDLKIKFAGIEKDIESFTESSAFNENNVDSINDRILSQTELVSNLENKLAELRAKISTQKGEAGELENYLTRLETEKKKLAEQNLEFEAKQREINNGLNALHEKRNTIFEHYTRYETKREQLSADHERLAAKIWEDYELTYSAALELNYPPVTEDNHKEFTSGQTELKNKLRALGNVNVSAIEEYADVKERYESGKAQYDDLIKSQESLSDIINRLEGEMRTKFVNAFNDINANFSTTFKELFGGGTAEISLTDPENVLTSGIDINVAPPGKIIKNLIALSGGEQSFVAIALIFAILNVNPTPFCIFDEIESALDEVNVIRLSEYMKRYSEKTQFIVITHRRGTMEAANMLYGITMPDRGISKVLSMNVDEAEKKLGERLN